MPSWRSTRSSSSDSSDGSGPRSGVLSTDDIRFEWRGTFENDELNALHAEAFDHSLSDHDWRNRVERHSLGWACARHMGRLVGFVNVPWDGGPHAFVIDPIVAIDSRQRGIGRRLVEMAVEAAREAGSDWIHVDFDTDLASFYLDACGFEPTPAGVLRLSARDP